MKHLLFLLSLLYFVPAYGQEYRIVYADNSLPELYDPINIVVQQKKGNSYTTLAPSKYKLSTTEATYKNGTLLIDRGKLQRNNGIVNFILAVQGQNIPMQLQLPVLKNIRYNLYTDSIKPVLNYYINIEGEYTNGRILPLDSNSITIQANHGSINGMEWVLPAERNFESVTFTATAKNEPRLKIIKTVYLKTYHDPRDATDYKDASEEEIIKGNKRRR